MQKIIVVFDICSSTSILEILMLNGRAMEYEKIITEETTIFEKKLSAEKPSFYKYLGDGNIYFFNEDTIIDNLIENLCGFIEESVYMLNRFLKRFIDRELNRIGVTVGIALGDIYETQKIGTQKEYFGRPINMACRLQSSLNGKDQINKILIQKEVFQRLKKKELRKWFNIRRKILSNINADLETQCYEIDPYNEDLERNET